MKFWALKNKHNEYLCKVLYFSYGLIPVENDCVDGRLVLGETKCSLEKIMKDFNEDIKPKYRVKPVKIELQMKVTEIKKEKK